MTPFDPDQVMDALLDERDDDLEAAERDLHRESLKEAAGGPYPAAA